MDCREEWFSRHKRCDSSLIFAIVCVTHENHCRIASRKIVTCGKPQIILFLIGIPKLGRQSKFPLTLHFTIVVLGRSLDCCIVTSDKHTLWRNFDRVSSESLEEFKIFSLLYPRFNWSWQGVYLFHFVVCLFVCPPVRPSVDGIVSTLYLQQHWLDPFYICTSHQATSEDVSVIKLFAKFEIWIFGIVFKFVTWNLSCFYLGSDMNQ